VGSTRPPRFARSAVAVTIAGLLLLTVAPGSVGRVGSVAAATLATTTDALNLRSGPSLGNAVILVMPAGAPVDVTGDPQHGFYPVTYVGTAGWASGDYLSFGTSGGGGGSATTTDALNLRAEPSLAATVLTVMPAGSTVTLTGGSSGDFLAVRYGSLDGWAARAYLSTGGGGGGGGGGGADGGSATVREDLNLRASPDLSAEVLFVMRGGVSVSLTGERSAGFAEVVYQGIRGWAYATYLDDDGGSGGSAPTGPVSNPNGYAPPTPGSGTAIVTESLNLRSSASTGSTVRAVMPAGATVTLTGSAQNGFYLVLYQGQRGWASSRYLLTGGRPADAYGYGQALIEGFIRDAAVRYGQDPAAMLRVARCESNLAANAVNPAGSYGIFQFVRSTWDSTPYADHDVFEAWANANAAAWMWSVGRRNEWVCQ
jgi:uncharacterized protein YraI